MNAIQITLVALTLLPATALAQPVPIELHAVDARQPLRVAYAGAAGYGCVEGIGCHDERSYQLAHKAAMQDEPGYGAARAKKIVGIVLVSVGGAGAGLMGFIALIAALGESLEHVGDYEGDQYKEDDHMARNFGIAALCSLGVALAVGLPVLISGVSDGREIRRRARQRLAAGSVELASGPGQAGLGLRYRF
jgi:hypothetical protein